MKAPEAPDETYCMWCGLLHESLPERCAGCDREVAGRVTTATTLGELAQGVGDGTLRLVILRDEDGTWLHTTYWTGSPEAAPASNPDEMTFLGDP